MHILINDCSIFFDVYGSKLNVLSDRVIEKPTLLVLHGGHGMVDHTLYVEFWSQFSDIAQVIFIDQRGCGRSDPRNASEWNLHQWAEDLFEFCRVLQIEKPIMAGVSMGGHVMCDYVKHHADQPGALIFCNTEARFVLDDVCAVMTQKGGPEVGEIARQQFSSPTPEISKQYQERCVPHYAKNAYSSIEISRCKKHMDVFSHFCKDEILNFNYLEDIQNICCPTLFMVGEESPLHPPVRAFEMLERVPRDLGHLHLFKNSGAAVYKDAPEEAAQVVREFIKNLDIPERH